MYMNVRVLSHVPTERAKRDAVIFCIGVSFGVFIGFILSHAGYMI